MRLYPSRPFYGSRATDDHLPDPLDDDPLLEEFRKLEREVRQRECEHETVVDISTFGDPKLRMCADCGKRWSP